MAKKQNDYYFKNFVECAELACKGSQLLENIVKDFDVAKLDDYRREMHDIEHSADMKKHEMLNVLIKAFITPIDREDILAVSQNIDELSDKIEDVLIRIYFNQVKAIRPRAVEFVSLVNQCFGEVLEMLREFEDFKRSKTLKDHLININSLEEQADKLYIDCMYELHDGNTEVLEVIAWTDVYTYLEKCADTCEHIADLVESVAMKNS